MRKAFWFSLAILGTTVGCESLLGEDVGARQAGKGPDGDPTLTTGGGNDCEKESLDAVGCACAGGSAPRSCFTGSIEQAGKGRCTFGSQECQTSMDSEIETSAWGPCIASGQATAETCGNATDDDCNGVVDDCGGGDDSGGGDDNGGTDEGGTGGGDENDCCGDRLADCLASGQSASTCATLDEICKGGACTDLVAACDPTSVPVSAACAQSYYTCFEFRVNKCMREGFDNCMGSLADATLCAAWDASCGAREDYCATILGVDCGESPNGCLEDTAGWSYYCTDWGHLFDPCWEAYQSCNLDPQVCAEQMMLCMPIGDIYAPLCDNGDPGLPDEMDPEKR